MRHQYISQETHLAISPVTKISPFNGSFPNITSGAEEEFKRVCEHAKGFQMVDKKPIIWSKKDPLHFWQSLAFTLRSEELICVAISSFVDTKGENKLYVASNNEMKPSQQQEVTDIINMFLDSKPINGIAEKLVPRHLSHIIKQFEKINLAQLKAFSEEFPSLVSQVDAGKLVDSLNALFSVKNKPSLEDIRGLINLITANRKVLRAMKESLNIQSTSVTMKDGTTIQNISEHSKKMAYHLMKMVRVLEEIYLVWKKVVWKQCR